MAAPQIYGLVGYPVKHSLSPAMHNAAFKARGINARYCLFEVPAQELEDFLLNPDKKITDTNHACVRAADILGFNVTIPHKVMAKQILEAKFGAQLDKPLAEVESYYIKLSGALNTVKREAAGLRWRNTDAYGFLISLKEDLKFDSKNKKVLLIGGGGAGRAVVAGLSWKNMGVSCIYVYDKSPDAVFAAQEHFLLFPHLKDKLKFIANRDIAPVIKECQLLVNTSPVGMNEGDSSVIDKSLLHKDLYVYDAVYNRTTQLIQDARQNGRAAAGGLGMLLYQGAAAWEFWTGEPAPVKVMRRVLESAVKKL